MNNFYQQIKKIAPLAYKNLIEWREEIYQIKDKNELYYYSYFRDIYDYLDNNGIYVIINNFNYNGEQFIPNLNFSLFDFGYDLKDERLIELNSKLYFNTRKNAEEWIFLQAFKILENKLKIN